MWDQKRREEIVTRWDVVPVRERKGILNYHIIVAGFVPDVGELMLASFPAEKSFTSSISPDNAWYTIASLDCSFF